MWCIVLWWGDNTVDLVHKESGTPCIYSSRKTAMADLKEFKADLSTDWRTRYEQACSRLCGYQVIEYVKGKTIKTVEAPKRK
jgi:hypothetical protein